MITCATAALIITATAVAVPATACASSTGTSAVRTAPKLTGPALVGERVHASRGTWTAHPTGYRYAWRRCEASGTDCARISGADSATYRVTGRDLGSRLRAVVTAVIHQAPVRARSLLSARVAVRPVATPCSGVRVAPGADVAGLVAAHPAGTTFCFRPGRYPIGHTIDPKRGDRLIGQPGATLDAGIIVRHWLRIGAMWAARAPRTVPTFSYGGGYAGSYKHPQAVYADDVFESNLPLVKAGVEYAGQVVGSGVATLGAGQYFYDYDHGLIYLGADPAGHRIELESLPGGVIHSYRSDVTVRGLTVQGSLGDGIVTGSGSNWVVDGNEVRLNHSEGVRVTNGGRILRNYIHDNGTYGIAATGNSMRIVGNEVARNNTSRYYRADGECSDAGGSKITLSRNVTLEQNWYHRNHCIGIWFDIDNYGVTIAHNHVDGNYENGIDYEISYNAVIERNEVSGSPHWGILDSASPNVTISGNSVAGNGDGSIVLNQGPRTDFPSAYGPHYARNVFVHGNRIVMRSGRAGAQEEGVSGTPFAGVVFSATNRFARNHYILANLRSRWFDWAGGPVTIAMWRSAGQDAGSTFSTR
jgi:Right handed beta helix region